MELDLARLPGCVPVEMLGGAAFPPIGQLPYLLTLPPYGFYWFLLVSKDRDARLAHAAAGAAAGLRTFVLRKDVSRDPGAAASAGSWSGRCCPPICRSAAGSPGRTIIAVRANRLEQHVA